MTFLFQCCETIISYLILLNRNITMLWNSLRKRKNVKNIFYDEIINKLTD